MHKKSYIPPNRSNPFSLLPNTNNSDSNDDNDGDCDGDNKNVVDTVDKNVINKDAVDKDAVDKDAVDKDAVDKDAVDKDAVDKDVDFKVYYSKKNDNRGNSGNNGNSGYGGNESGRNGGYDNRGNGGYDNRGNGGYDNRGNGGYESGRNGGYGGRGGSGSSGGWRNGGNSDNGRGGSGWRGGSGNGGSGGSGGNGGWRGGSGGIGRYDNNFKRVSDSQSMNNVEPLQYVFSNVPDNIGDIAMNNNYRVLAHHNADSNWNFDSYHHVSTLKKWEDVPKLFNTLNETKYGSKITDFDFFIMKNEISPLWEDEENRCGSICSIKIDTLKDGYNILKTLFVHICNNTLMNITKNNVPNWNIINGVSFSCKKVENVSSVIEQDYSMIKIWFKTNYTQFENIDKYFNDDINALLKKYSIKVRAIKPEY